jgi:hypothetical protein
MSRVGHRTVMAVLLIAAIAMVWNVLSGPGVNGR